MIRMLWCTESSQATESYYVFVVSYVPSWFPGAKFKRLAQHWSSLLPALKDRPFDRVKRELVRFTDPFAVLSSH